MRSLIATAVAAVASATIMDEVEFSFIQFIAKYGKSYSSRTEFNERLANFKETDTEIKKLNAEQTRTRHGHNKFSDWSRSEYEQLLGLKDVPVPELNGNMHVATN